MTEEFSTPALRPCGDSMNFSLLQNEKRTLFQTQIEQKKKLCPVWVRCLVGFDVQSNPHRTALQSSKLKPFNVTISDLWHLNILIEVHAPTLPPHWLIGRQMNNFGSPLLQSTGSICTVSIGHRLWDQLKSRSIHQNILLERQIRCET